jgi:hypothetical protein
LREQDERRKAEEAWADTQRFGYTGNDEPTSEELVKRELRDDTNVRLLRVESDDIEDEEYFPGPST